MRGPDLAGSRIALRSAIFAIGAAPFDDGGPSPHPVIRLPRDLFDIGDGDCTQRAAADSGQHLRVGQRSAVAITLQSRCLLSYGYRHVHRQDQKQIDSRPYGPATTP
jgi:hypothetical protein